MPDKDWVRGMIQCLTYFNKSAICTSLRFPVRKKIKSPYRWRSWRSRKCWNHLLC